MGRLGSRRLRCEEMRELQIVQKANNYDWVEAFVHEPTVMSG